MGHYDDIREQRDAEEARDYRKAELERLVSELAQQLGKIGYTEPTVSNLLSLQSEAGHWLIKMKNTMDRGDILFYELFNAGELDIKYTPKA